MEKIQFASSPKPTLGIELELSLVDAQTMALSSSILQVVPQVPEKFAGRIKPELMQCFVEINTEVCETVGQAEADLREKLDVLEQIVAVAWACGCTGPPRTRSRCGKSSRPRRTNATPCC